MDIKMSAEEIKVGLETYSRPAKWRNCDCNGCRGGNADVYTLGYRVVQWGDGEIMVEYQCHKYARKLADMTVGEWLGLDKQKLRGDLVVIPHYIHVRAYWGLRDCYIGSDGECHPLRTDMYSGHPVRAYREHSPAAYRTMLRRPMLLTTVKNKPEPEPPQPPPPIRLISHMRLLMAMEGKT